MPTGIVKWFDEEKGWGHIVPDVAARGVFFHAADVLGPGPPAANQQVEFELTATDQGPVARAVRLRRRAVEPLV